MTEKLADRVINDLANFTASFSARGISKLPSSTSQAEVNRTAPHLRETLWTTHDA